MSNNNKEGCAPFCATVRKSEVRYLNFGNQWLLMVGLGKLSHVTSGMTFYHRPACMSVACGVDASAGDGGVRAKRIQTFMLLLWCGSLC